MEVMLSFCTAFPLGDIYFQLGYWSWSITIISSFYFSFKLPNCLVKVCLEWQWEWYQVTVFWMAF